MKTQKEFVEQCIAFYLEQGLEPGNPDDGDWEIAHYPQPQPEGTETVLLLHGHHQVQGLLQSEEVGRCCFFSGGTKKFLTDGSFIESWFELWELHEKWSSIRNLGVNEVLHSEKDEEGKSVHAVKAGKETHREKDEQGRSLRNLKLNEELHTEKDEQGRSLHAMKSLNHGEKDELGRSVTAVAGAKAANAEKDPVTGKSVNALAGGKAAHAEKDDQGRSLHARNTARYLSKKCWKCPECELITNAGSLSSHQRASGHTGRIRVEGDGFPYLS